MLFVGYFLQSIGIEWMDANGWIRVRSQEITFKFNHIKPVKEYETERQFFFSFLI